MIDLYDEVEVKISDKFEITSNSKDIPLDEKNLVYKVYKALKEKYKFNERFSILIEKIYRFLQVLQVVVQIQLLL